MMATTENIEILKAIIHCLDVNMTEPNLSNHLLVLDEDIIEYLATYIEKAFSSDEMKTAKFREDSYFKGVLKGFDDNFVDQTREVALRYFSVMEQSGMIPSGDLVIMMTVIDGEDYLVMLKINYKSSFVHEIKTVADQKTTMLYKQGGILPAKPSKPSEAAFINLSTQEVTVIEKRYDINGVKDYYLSTLILGCTSDLPAKSKLDIVKSAAETIYKASYGDTMDKTPMVANVLINEITDDSTIKMDALCEKFAETFPEATSDIVEVLQERNLDVQQEIPVPESVIRKLGTQSLKTHTGLMVMVPTQEYYNLESMEFITNEDGTIDVLVKNIVKEKKAPK